MKTKTLTPKEMSILEYKMSRKYPRSILQALAQRINNEDITDDNIDDYERLLDLLMKHIPVTDQDEENLRLLISKLDDLIDEYHFSEDYPVIKDEEEDEDEEDYSYEVDNLQKILDEVQELELSMNQEKENLSNLAKLRNVIGDIIINMGQKIKK